jgi:uncharacterized membrane protein
MLIHIDMFSPPPHHNAIKKRGMFMLRSLSILVATIITQTAVAAPIISDYSAPAGFGNVAVYDITRDGRCAVGDASSDATSVALRWCDGAATIIPVLTTDGFNNSAIAISDDGKTVVGASGAGGRGQLRIAYKWTETGGTIALPGIDGQTRSSASDITPDGRYSAGQTRVLGSSSREFRAIRWDNETPTKLDASNQLSFQLIAAISHDGKVIVGNGYDANALHDRGFIWTEAGGFSGVNPSADYIDTDFSTLSGDGRFIGGSVRRPDDAADAALWSSDGSLLKTFHIDGLDLSLLSLTETGAMGLVTTLDRFTCDDPLSCPPPPKSYFIYQSGLDLLSFDSWFVTMGGTFPADWSAIRPTGFSDTGEFLIGQATRDGSTLAWRADLRGGLVSVDEPQTALLFFGALGLMFRRRQMIRRAAQDYV